MMTERVNVWFFFLKRKHFNWTQHTKWKKKKHKFYSWFRVIGIKQYNFNDGLTFEQKTNKLFLQFNLSIAMFLFQEILPKKKKTFNIYTHYGLINYHPTDYFFCTRDFFFDLFINIAWLRFRPISIFIRLFLSRGCFTTLLLFDSFENNSKKKSLPCQIQYEKKKIERNEFN